MKFIIILYIFLQALWVQADECRRLIQSQDIPPVSKILWISKMEHEASLSCFRRFRLYFFKDTLNSKRKKIISPEKISSVSADQKNISNTLHQLIEDPHSKFSYKPSFLSQIKRIKDQHTIILDSPQSVIYPIEVTESHTQIYPSTSKNQVDSYLREFDPYIYFQNQLGTEGFHLRSREDLIASLKTTYGYQEEIKYPPVLICDLPVADEFKDFIQSYQENSHELDLFFKNNPEITKPLSYLIDFKYDSNIFSSKNILMTNQMTRFLNRNVLDQAFLEENLSILNEEMFYRLKEFQKTARFSQFLRDFIIDRHRCSPQILQEVVTISYLNPPLAPEIQIEEPGDNIEDSSRLVVQPDIQIGAYLNIKYHIIESVIDRHLVTKTRIHVPVSLMEGIEIEPNLSNEMLCHPPVCLSKTLESAIDSIQKLSDHEIQF